MTIRQVSKYCLVVGSVTDALGITTSGKSPEIKVDDQVHLRLSSSIAFISSALAHSLYFEHDATFVLSSKLPTSRTQANGSL